MSKFNVMWRVINTACTSLKIEVDFGDTYVEHVLHVVDRDERIIDVYDLDLLLELCGAHHQTADSSETIDTDFDGGPNFFRAMATILSVGQRR